MHEELNDLNGVKMLSIKMVMPQSSLEGTSEWQSFSMFNLLHLIF